MNTPPYFTIVPSWTCIFKRFYVETSLVYFAIKKVTCHKTDNFLFFIPVLITEPALLQSHTGKQEFLLSFQVLHQYRSLHTHHVCNLQHGLSFLQAEDLRLLLFTCRASTTLHVSENRCSCLHTGCFFNSLSHVHRISNALCIDDDVILLSTFS